ncbi:MAG TPA: RNA polymerase sigma factor [Phycisphaerae bacterium]|nr:RNA polymerase sigma factor [Phycisphaerae bacterium]HRW53105.1 RNA polymerase sigma factor [Phycisphaerae bacterium]
MTDSTPTTEQLVRQAVAGDADALTALLQAFGPEVERTLQINPVWRSMVEPADVMQVTYLEAFLRIGSFDPDRSESFAGWLRRIAQNNLKDAIRGLERQKQPQPKNRVKPPKFEDSLVGLYEMLEAGISTPSRQVRRKEACQLLESSIRLLPDRYGEVIRRYDLECQSITDVATALGKSAGAVHMLRARAHDRLREQLGSASGFLDTEA